MRLRQPFILLQHSCLFSDCYSVFLCTELCAGQYLRLLLYGKIVRGGVQAIALRQIHNFISHAFALPFYQPKHPQNLSET